MATSSDQGKIRQFIQKNSSNIILIALFIYVVLLAFATCDEIFGWDIMVNFL